MTDRWIRLLLAFNLVGILPLAIWPLVSPKGFYDNFPGGSYHWIDINGPYNQHFLIDFGALNAALVIVLGFAFWKLTPSLVQAAGLALAVYALPHSIYHLSHLDVYKSSEKLTAVMPLILQFVSGLAIVWLSSRRRPSGSPAS